MRKAQGLVEYVILIVAVAAAVTAAVVLIAAYISTEVAGLP